MTLCSAARTFACDTPSFLAMAASGLVPEPGVEPAAGRAACIADCSCVVLTPSVFAADVSAVVEICGAPAPPGCAACADWPDEVAGVELLLDAPQPAAVRA